MSRDIRSLPESKQSFFGYFWPLLIVGLKIVCLSHQVLQTCLYALSLCSLWLHIVCSVEDQCVLLCVSFLCFCFIPPLRPFSWRSVSPHCCQCPLVSQRPHSCPSTSATLSRETFSQMHIHALAKRVKGTFDCTSYQIRDHVCTQKKNTKDFSRSLHSIGKQF